MLDIVEQMLISLISIATGLMSVDAHQEKLKAAKENGCLPSSYPCSLM